VKVECSLMPRRANLRTIAAPTTNLGNAETTSAFSAQPESTKMYTGFQVVQSSIPSLHVVVVGTMGCWLSGSESRRMDDHQKCGLGDP